MAESRIHRSQREFNRNADVIADAGGRSARAAAETVDGDDIRAGARNAGRNRRDVMHRRNLNDDRLGVPRRFLERENQLAQILDGVDIMVRRGGNGVRAFWNHARFGNICHNLPARQMPADARLRALPHLDFNRRARVQVIVIDAEASRRDLHNRVFAVLVEVLLRRAREGLMRVIANRAVRHGGEHNRHFELELGRRVVNELAILVAADAFGTATEVDARLHRLTQRVNGRVRDLRGVNQQLIPVHRQRRGIAHRGQDFRHRLRGVVDVILERVVGLDDFQRAGRAERHAALAVDARAFVGNHQPQFRVVLMHLVGALAFADAAGDAAVLVAHHLIRGIEKIHSHQARPPSVVKMTG